eukprot:245532-Rhodomonas_salina.3
MRVGAGLRDKHTPRQCWRLRMERVGRYRRWRMMHTLRQYRRMRMDSCGRSENRTWRELEAPPLLRRAVRRGIGDGRGRLGGGEGGGRTGGVEVREGERGRVREL